MRQLIKYCMVGASSTIIDLGIYWILSQILPPTVPWYVLKTISFCFGVTNGFFWNRHWTFRAREHGTSRQQYPKFFLANTIGWGLNLALTKFFLFLITGKLTFAANPPAKTVMLASLCAIPIVVIWNFTASRLWTFRAPNTREETASLAPPIASAE